MLAHVLSAYARLSGAVAGLALAVVFAVVLLASVSRYFLGIAFPWSGEVAVYAMVYGTMFGSVHAYCHGRHMRFPFLVDQMPEAGRRGVGVLIDLLVLTAGVVLTVSGWEFAARRGGIPSSGIGVRMVWFQAGIAVGGVALAAGAVLRLLVGRGAFPDADVATEEG